MTIPIRFITVVTSQSAVEGTFPGGLSEFLAWQPDCALDERLVAVAFMSGGEADEFLGALAAKGIDVAAQCAVCDMWAGPFQLCQGISLTRVGTGPLSNWQAEASA